MAWNLKFLGYLKSLSLKFKKSGNEQNWSFPVCALFSLGSSSLQPPNQDRDWKSSIWLVDFWNFKFKVFKYPRNFRTCTTVILKFGDTLNLGTMNECFCLNSKCLGNLKYSFIFRALYRGYATSTYWDILTLK